MWGACVGVYQLLPLLPFWNGGASVLQTSVLYWVISQTMGQSPTKWKQPASLKVWQRCTSWHRTRTVNFPLFILWPFQPNNGVTCWLDFRIFKWYKHVLRRTKIVTRQWSIEVGIIVQDWGFSQRCCSCEIGDFETSANIFNSVWHIPEFWFYQAISNNLKWGRSQSLICRKRSRLDAADCPRIFRWMLETVDGQVGNKWPSFYEAALRSETVQDGSNSPTID